MQICASSVCRRGLLAGEDWLRTLTACNRRRLPVCWHFLDHCTVAIGKFQVVRLSGISRAREGSKTSRSRPPEHRNNRAYFVFDNRVDSQD